MCKRRSCGFVFVTSLLLGLSVCAGALVSSQRTSLSGLPVAAQFSMSAIVGRNDSVYSVHA